MYKNCLFRVFEFSSIVNIIKFRFLSKYNKLIVDEYITKNKKICDMKAYDCKYLLTPEYLVIGDSTHHKIKTRSKNIGSVVVNTYLAFITNIIIDHINNHYNTLRLIKFNIFYHPYTDLKLLVNEMPKLEYLDVSKNFSLKSIDTPSIKYYDGTDLNPKYKVKTTYIGNDITNAYGSIENIFIYYFKHIKFLPEFTNCKRLYINCSDTWSKNISLEISKIYIEECNFGDIDIIDLFLGVKKIYLSPLPKIMRIKGIKLSLYTNDNDEDIVEINNMSYNEKMMQNKVFKKIKKIKIYNFTLGLDLIKIFPNLKKIHICSDIFNFKLYELQIKNMVFYNKIKKLVFLD